MKTWILIVEDEPLVALNLEMMVTWFIPATVVVEASVAATKKVLHEGLDFAFLDVDVTNGKTFEVAQTDPIGISSGSGDSLPDQQRSSGFMICAPRHEGETLRQRIYLSDVVPRCPAWFLNLGQDAALDAERRRTLQLSALLRLCALSRLSRRLLLSQDSGTGCFVKTGFPKYVLLVEGRGALPVTISKEPAEVLDGDRVGKPSRIPGQQAPIWRAKRGFGEVSWPGQAAGQGAANGALGVCCPICCPRQFLLIN